MYNREQADELEAHGWLMVEVTALGDLVKSFAKGRHLLDIGIIRIEGSINVDLHRPAVEPVDACYFATCESGERIPLSRWHVKFMDDAIDAYAMGGSLSDQEIRLAGIDMGLFKNGH